MKNILIATTKEFQNNELFNLDNPVLNRDNCLEPYHALRTAFAQNGYNLTTIDKGPLENAEYILFFEAGGLKELLKELGNKNLKTKMILLIWEPPVVSPENYNPKLHAYFDRVFTWNDDLVDNKKYLKFYWPQPSYNKALPKNPFTQKKLLTLIAGNKASNQPNELYSARLEAIKYFGLYYPKEFAFYGMGWSYQPSIFDKIKELFTPSFYRCYRGKVLDKTQVLAEYKFSICYENMSGTKGYLTEKLFDSFKAGCVPVYWGASNIEEYVPKDCFIDKRNFKTYDDLATFLVNMSEKTYRRYQENIKNYLDSKQFEPFTVKSFTKTIINGVLGA